MADSTFYRKHDGGGLRLGQTPLDGFANEIMVFEHLFDPFHSFRQIRRVLGPEGRAYFNVPLITSLRHRLDLLLGRLPSTSSPYPSWFEKEEWDGGHLHCFSLASLHAQAHHCGLRSGLRIDVVRGVGRLRRLKPLLPELLASEVTIRLRGVGHGGS